MYSILEYEEGWFRRNNWRKELLALVDQGGALDSAGFIGVDRATHLPWDIISFPDGV